MLRFALAQMRAAIGRLTAAGLAIVLATGFVAASLLTTAIVKATAESAVSAEMRGADVLVIPRGVAVAQSQVDAVAALGGVRAVDPQRRVSLILQLGSHTKFQELVSLPVVAPPPPVIRGELPKAADQVAIDADDARSFNISVGDRIWWRFPDADTKAAGQFTVTGITERGSSFVSGSGPVLLGTPRGVAEIQKKTSASSPGVTQVVLLYGDHTVGPVELAARATTVFSGDQYKVLTAREVIDQQVKRLTGNTAFFVLFALGFAAVAAIVAAMVIANTFEVLVAQRARMLALVRCAGATKGQIRSSVLIEAALLGLATSVVGVIVGVGLAQLAVWFLERQNLGITTPSLDDINLYTLFVPVIVGVVVTTFAAIGPARHATRVSPVAALRPQVAPDVRRGGRARLVIGAIVMVIGLVLLLGVPMAVLIGAQDKPASGGEMVVALLLGVFGGVLTVVGFLILAVFVMPVILRALGRAAVLLAPARVRATATLATANAIRDPQRSAATASALVIGVGLVVMMGTGAASARESMDAALHERYPVDVIISATGSEGLNSAEITAAKHADGVRATAAVWNTASLPDPEFSSVYVADPGELSAVIASPVPTARGHVTLNARYARLLKVSDGGTINLLVVDPQGERKVPAKVIVQPDLPLAAVVAPGAFSEIKTTGRPAKLLVDVDDQRASEVASNLQHTVAAASPALPANVTSAVELRLAYNKAIDSLLAVLIGLLMVAVVIALVGVANTLSLSVIERRREHGVLRAMGVSRTQLRQMLAIEGVLIAVTGAVGGTVLGLLCGWSGAAILLGGARGFAFGMDWLITGACLVVALVAGMTASVLPARSAVKVSPVVALATE